MHISTSQIKTFKICRRQWAWRYIDHLPSVEHAATAFGTYTHSLLEDFGTSGKVPDTKEIWRFHGQGRAYYPGKTALQMIDGLQNIISIEMLRGRGNFERKFAVGRKVLAKHGIDVPEDVELVGIIDISILLSWGLLIIDHKTSSDPIKWGLTVDDL